MRPPPCSTIFLQMASPMPASPSRVCEEAPPMRSLGRGATPNGRRRDFCTCSTKNGHVSYLNNVNEQSLDWHPAKNFLSAAGSPSYFFVSLLHPAADFWRLFLCRGNATRAHRLRGRGPGPGSGLLTGRRAPGMIFV